MNLATALLKSLLLVGFVVAPVMAQSTGDYRTRASGNWSQGANWERFSGTAWTAVATPPTGSETITVRAAHEININVAVTITGRLINQGVVEEDGLLTIANGGVYQHDLDEGSVPQATWAPGSTFHITGTVATAPANRNQSYHHIIFETPGLVANRDMNLDDVTIGGNITVRNTGSARWHLTSAPGGQSRTVTIMGDVRVEAGQFTVHGTSNVNTHFVVEHHGNIIVTGGNFSITRGSQPLGTTYWNLHEGNFSMSGAAAQNSNTTERGAAFVFRSGDVQTLTLTNNNPQVVPIEVRDGTTLNLGSTALKGSGHFLLEDDSILGTSLPGGVTAIFTDVTGAIELQDNSGYWFNGNAAQSTSGRMPQQVSELIIENPAGVTLSQATTINDVLRLRAGAFDNTIPFTLGSEGRISYEGGSLVHPVSTENVDGAPGFFVDQNFPNPFVGSTTVRFGLPTPSPVTITVYNVLGQRVMTAFDQTLGAAVHEISLDLSELSSGVYLYRVQTETSQSTRQMIQIR